LACRPGVVFDTLSTAKASLNNIHSDTYFRIMHVAFYDLLRSVIGNTGLNHCQFKINSWIYSCVGIGMSINYRGALISKLTNIPITNASAIKSTDTNITT